MAGSGPHQTSPHHAESANVHQQGELHDLKRGDDMDNQQEGRLQTFHTGGSGNRRRGHAIHKHANEKAMQREIDDLKKRLRRAQRKQTPSSFNVSSNDEEDASYRLQSGTPPNESFSCEDEHPHKRRLTVFRPLKQLIKPR